MIWQGTRQDVGIAFLRMAKDQGISRVGRISCRDLWRKTTFEGGARKKPRGHPRGLLLPSGLIPVVFDFSCPAVELVEFKPDAAMVLKLPDKAVSGIAEVKVGKSLIYETIHIAG